MGICVITIWVDLGLLQHGPIFITIWGAWVITVWIDCYYNMGRYYNMGQFLLQYGLVLHYGSIIFSIEQCICYFEIFSLLFICYWVFIENRVNDARNRIGWS